MMKIMKAKSKGGINSSGHLQVSKVILRGYIPAQYVMLAVLEYLETHCRMPQKSMVVKETGRRNDLKNFWNR